MNNPIKIAVLGATGYVGLELVRLLSKHTKVKLLYLCATKSIGKKINEFDKRINKKLPKITVFEEKILKKVDIIFSALPNGEAQKLSKKINDGNKLIDLSGDFRLKKINEYKKWYGKTHKNMSKNTNSVYGLTEFKRKEIKKFQIISCPGCYPTSIQIPLIPLLKNKLIKTSNIVIDSKSGYSGAGKQIFKKISKNILFNTISAYGVGSHKHMPEIDQELSLASGNKVQIFFTPHLIPMFRGILTTIYLDLKKNVTAKQVYNCLKRSHKKNFFVKIGNFNSPFGTGDVINSNFCKVSVFTNRIKNKIIIISALDNLIKGASGQAIQNMNIICGFKETESLV